MGHCDGKNRRSMVVLNLPCPHCGHELEFFSDDTELKCSKCGNTVKREEAENPATNRKE